MAVQGMNIIKAASEEHSWGVDLGELARIWKGGCIIRARFLDRIKAAYVADPQLASLLVDPGFAKDLVRAHLALCVTTKMGQWGASCVPTSPCVTFAPETRCVVRVQVEHVSSPECR